MIDWLNWEFYDSSYKMSDFVISIATYFLLPYLRYGCHMWLQNAF